MNIESSSVYFFAAGTGISFGSMAGFLNPRQAKNSNAMSKETEPMSQELRDKIRDVKTDNEGRPERQGDVTCREVAEDVDRLNPDVNTLDRG